MKGTSKHTDERGFSLIELIVAMTIMGIVMAIAVPGMRTFFMNNTQARAMNEFTGFISYARSEATRRGVTVTICGSQNGLACGANWENGWLVFQDNDGLGTVSAGDTILKFKGGGLGNGLTLRGVGVANRITMTPRGFSLNNGTMKFCDGRGAQGAKALIISNTGRVRRASDGNGNGIVETGGGIDIACP